MKLTRIGVLLVLVVGLVFAVEGTLAAMRQRNLFFSVELRDSSGVVNTPRATGQAATPRPGSTPDAAVLSLPVDGTVVVNARWDYKIGPTFPRTDLVAEAVASTGGVVANDTYTVDCGNATMECTGTRPLNLSFGVMSGKGTRADWPAGTYTIRVTRRFGGLNSAEIFKQDLTVRPKS